MFQEGSTFAWIEMRTQSLLLAARVLTGAATVLAVPAGELIGREIRAYQLHNQINTILQKNQPMVKYRNFRFSPHELEESGVRALNYEARGISDDERRHWIALVQLAVNVELRIDVSSAKS